MLSNMCTNLQYIKNPNYIRSPVVSEFGQVHEVDTRLYSHDEYIEVPCGKCAECRAVYFQSIFQRAIVESRTSYMYFITLTYDNEHLPSVLLPNGKRIFYSDYRHIQLMFKRIRNEGLFDRDFRYLVVTEFGDKKHRPHFHLLFFLSKRVDDSPSTPYHYEKFIFDNFKKFYVVNVGTRKNPSYESLFTYRIRHTRFGIRTNYFVKYVEPTVDNPALPSSENVDFVKTIRYLIGYVNKGSSFDTVVEKYLDELTDTLLVKKLRVLLKSKIRYSKGFGNGFDDGEKLDLPIISKRGAFISFFYTDLVKQLPDTFAQFVEEYPMYLDDVCSFIRECPYRKYDTLDAFIYYSDFHRGFLHLVCLIYFPNYFDWVYRMCYYSNPLRSPGVSYFTHFLHYRYHYKKSLYESHELEENPTFSFIRNGIEQSISSGLPFIGFSNVPEGRFYSLCKYYRERCSTLLDTIRMYDKNNIKDWSEWVSLFEKHVDNSKAVRESSEYFSHEEKEILEKNLQNQKSCLSLYSDSDLYRTAFRVL